MIIPFVPNAHEWFILTDPGGKTVYDWNITVNDTRVRCFLEQAYS